MSKRLFTAPNTGWNSYKQGAQIGVGASYAIWGRWSLAADGPSATSTIAIFIRVTHVEGRTHRRSIPNTVNTNVIFQ